MKKFCIVAATVLPLLFLGACASTFVASKDGKGYYLGNNSTAAYQLFCESGDLKKILEDTTKLDQELKNALYEDNCGSGRSHDKVKQDYAGMSPEQRKDLRLAFKRNGYDINIMRC